MLKYPNLEGFSLKLDVKIKPLEIDKTKTYFVLVRNNLQYRKSLL